VLRVQAFQTLLKGQIERESEREREKEGERDRERYIIPSSPVREKEGGRE
jgi:hypothetical protein